MSDLETDAGTPNATPADRCWIVHDRGRQMGPHTIAELSAFLANGTIISSAQVWRTGMPQWIPLASIMTVPALPPTAMQMQTMGYANSNTSSNKTAAGICGILLGGLGIHKFILGYTTAGLIMLLVTVLTCGWGGIVMHIIGLIEGIIYLTKSDEQFHQEYVVNKKAWF